MCHSSHVLNSNRMKKELKLLILEDSLDDLDLIERELKRGGIQFIAEVVKTRGDYQSGLKKLNPDVILSDHSLPAFNSIEAMELWKEYQHATGFTIPFILITGSVSEEFAVQCIKAGAYDYILKDRLKRLPASILNALEKVRLEKERNDVMGEILSQTNLMKEAEHLANFGSWQVDLNTGKHRWSDEAFRIFGFMPGEIEPDYGKFFRQVHPEDQKTLNNSIREAVNSLGLQELEYRIIDRDLKVKHLHSRIIVKRDSEGRAFQLIGFTLDITKLKVQTEVLELQNKKLMEIAWTQSHEVRAPLARLMGLAQLLRHYPLEKIDLGNSLDHILESANELDAIIRKIVRKTESVL